MDEQGRFRIPPFAPYALAGLLLCLAYGLQVYFSANSSLIYIPYVSRYSDMHANLLWADSIVEQGWLNPKPHHPYNPWMRSVGTYPEFVTWWGGEAIFQQSPLYAYLLALVRWLTDDLLYVLIFQAVLGVLLCVGISRVAALMSGRAEVGWAALIIAAAYAPFYAYTTAVLRDLPSWTITAWLIVALLELDRIDPNHRRHRLLAGAIGMLLGLGFLCRETYALVIPIVGGILIRRFVQCRQFSTVACLTLALLATVSPLLIRNALVGAPLISSSNRFAEAFIQGHAGDAHPCQFVIPVSTRPILEKSGGHAAAVVVETLSTQPSIGAWLGLEWRKALSLLDPFESYDNVSLEFLGNISPFVRYGLKHWMVIVPGILGVFLGIRQREKRHFWLWIFLPILLAGVLLGLPLSRYRQSLMILWIPWAAYVLVELIRPVLHASGDGNQPKGAFAFQWLALALSIVAGWLLCLGPLARVPSTSHDRPNEYLMSVHIYQKLGQMDKAHHMAELIRKKFPEEKL